MVAAHGHVHKRRGAASQKPDESLVSDRCTPDIESEEEPELAT